MNKTIYVKESNILILCDSGKAIGTARKHSPDRVAISIGDKCTIFGDNEIVFSVSHAKDLAQMILASCDCVDPAPYIGNINSTDLD